MLFWGWRQAFEGIGEVISSFHLIEQMQIANCRWFQIHIAVERPFERWTNGPLSRYWLSIGQHFVNDHVEAGLKSSDEFLVKVKMISVKWNVYHEMQWYGMVWCVLSVYKISLIEGEYGRLVEVDLCTYDTLGSRRRAERHIPPH